MFSNFETCRAEVGAAAIYYKRGGRSDAPPVVLLHGYPQSHLCWRDVAPELAEYFDVFVPDLRGYGASLGPVPDPEHQNYAKRAMADDIVALMAEAGHARFAVAGHDRGGRVAYRMALDHPDVVSKLAVLDMIPTLDEVERTDREMALSTYHWFFLAQPAPMPETMIAANPEYYISWTINSWLGEGFELAPEAMATYCSNFARMSVIQAACEDYRAGMSSDLDNDRADRETGRKIQCPLHVLWGDKSGQGRDVGHLKTWSEWTQNGTDQVSGKALNCGHFLPEEKAGETAAELVAFLR